MLKSIILYWRNKILEDKTTTQLQSFKEVAKFFLDNVRLYFAPSSNVPHHPIIHKQFAFDD